MRFKSHCIFGLPVMRPPRKASPAPVASTTFFSLSVGTSTVYRPNETNFKVRGRTPWVLKTLFCIAYYDSNKRFNFLKESSIWVQSATSKT